MKKAILFVILFAFIAGCTLLSPLSSKYKDITLCGVDPKDCLTFTIPEQYPDFVNEFEDTAMCMGDVIMTTCIWYDGEKLEDDTIPNAIWYSVVFWSSYSVAGTSPVAMEVDNRRDEDNNILSHYLYDEKGKPIKKTEYEYMKYVYSVYGYEMPTEEEYYRQKREAQEELDKLIEEEKRKDLGQQET